MSEERPNLNVSESENLCVVCCKDLFIYSVGVCNHRVCYECSTRMRVLCSQNECPICRGQMPKVIFSEEPDDFASLFARFQNAPTQDRKYGLIFCSDRIRKAYQQLLEFRCAECSEASVQKRCVFYTFQQLKDHMRREHMLVYCDLCVDNLKIFPFERRTYTKQQLGYHRRKGDPDNTSHRGHPICEFCDTRFVDSDELFRHMRLNHLFCHFCDADGKNQYYNSMDNLKTHFRDEHYLCEEGECNGMPLTAVFRTNIDLKAHIAIEHGRYLSKSANKQARTLEFEFTLAPRPGTARGAMSARGRGHAPQMQPPRAAPPDEGAAASAMDSGGPGGGIQQINSLTPRNFPALGNVAGPTAPLSRVNFTSKVKPYSGTDFPSLGGRAPAVTITTNSSSARKKTAPEVTITRTLRGAPTQSLQKNPENFPCLGPPTTSTVHLSVNSGQQSAPNVSIHVSHNGAVTTTHITSSAHTNNTPTNQKPTEAFPALGGKTPAKNPQWVQQKSKKTEPKAKKVAPAPQLPPSDLSQFPTLSKKGGVSDKKKTGGANKKEDEKTSPAASSTWAIQEDTKKKKNKKNEKDKDKQNGGEQQANGLKRSELKIGALSLNETNKTPPPGFPAKPPPGFTNLTTTNFPSLSNDLTFTNSSGQSYAIGPANYHPPANFAARNQNLIKRSMKVLDNEMMKEFKSYSGLFRNGAMPAERYYTYCSAVLHSHFNELFTDLLVLLPDVQKQRDLYDVSSEEIRKNLVLCQNCKQVVYKRELSEHYNYHALESQFPTLGAKEGANVWRK